MTGVVLAGGDSRRFGANKALIPWKEGTLIEAVTGTLTGLFPTTLALVKKPDDFAFLERSGVRVVRDLLSDLHPMGGILSALSVSPTEHVFVCACDMPFIRPELIVTLSRERKGHDAVVPRWRGVLQPLCGIYAKRCMDLIRKRITEDRLKLQDLFQFIPTRIYDEDEVRSIDPEGLSFMDIDTRNDYEQARKKTGLERPGA